MKRIFGVLSFVVLLLAGSLSLRAQGIITGSITGTVADATGAVIPGAVVIATQTATNQSSKTISGKDGSFSFKALPIGSYQLVISNAGFSGLTLNHVDVDSNKVQSLGVQNLQAGSTNAVVEVNATANILETAQAQVTTTFDSQQVTNFPTAGGFDELALLIPGVVDTHADGFSNTNGANFSVNGERGRANNFEIDGQSNNDTSITGPQVFFGNDEAIAEIQVITNSFSAQYGRNAGSVVNYITKSGTNSFHGSAIYKYSGNFSSSLAQGVSKGVQFGFCGQGQTPQADGCAATVVPRYVDNFYGGTFGGPIIKNKLFAFGSTYWDRETEYGALITSQGSYFPTTAGLAQIAAAFPNSSSVAILQQLSPYAVTTGNPRQVGTVINETISGVSGTVPFSQFGRQVPFLSTDQEDLGRLDWQATPKDRVYLRYFYQTNPTAPDGATANGGYTNVTDVVHSVGADETHTFGPHWLNQIRYSFQQSKLAFDGGGYSTCLITSFGSCPASVGQMALPDGSPLSGLGLPSGDPQGRIVKVGQVQDNATWTIGNHAITFGGEFLYENAPSIFLPNSNGSFAYDTLSDFIAGGCGNGACSVAVAQGNPTIPFREKDVGLYFQDDWKVSSSLTFNLGLRWEFFGQPLNYLHSQSVAEQTGSNPFWDTSLPLSQTTLPAVANYYKNFEPRIGFAYNPGFNKRLVIRGAYAINVDPEYQNIALNVADSAPSVASGAIVCGTGTTNCIPTGGATFTTVQQQLAPQLPTGGNPGLASQTTAPHNFRNPVGQTYTLGVQYQLHNSAVIELRYVGNHTSQQFQSLNVNPYLATVAAAFPNVVNPSSLCAGTTALGGADAGFRNCGKTSVDQVSNTAFSQYQSLQTNLTTRSYHGVTATVAYTWSHNIDNTSEIYSTGAGGNTIAYSQNPLNADYGERANSALDFPNVGSLGLTYKIPDFHTGKNLLDRVMNGWTANTIWLYNSGQPYTDYQGISNGSPQINPDDVRTSQSYSDIPFEENFLGLDVARPILSNPKAPVGTLGIYTDTTITPATATTPATFSNPVLVDFASGAPVSPSQVHFIANNQLAANVLGNPYPGSTRNILRGDTFNNVDFSVSKNTKLTNLVTLRLEVDAYNVLNRGYYGAPGNNVADYSEGGGSSFNNFFQSQATGASLVTPGTGLRNLLFVGKILF
jgi:Carboxypeptidase regulatory-like domain/TonB-dependent Receptor Plug Domain/TonB dependent receptor